MDDIEINTLGINYYVNEMLSQIALIHFMSLKCNTFAKTTFEFFFNIVKVYTRGQDFSEGKVSFRFLIITIK